MSESSDSGALSESAMQNELESFDYEIEQINSQLKESKKQFREFKRVEGKINTESVVQICRCEIQLKLIERRKKFMEEKKITREMLEKMNKDYTFMHEIGQSYIDLAKSVVSDKAAGEDITNHDFYKEKFFFDLFYFGDYQFKISEFKLENLPEEVFSLAGKEQMENIIEAGSFFKHTPDLIRFGDKLQYLSEEQLMQIYYIDDRRASYTGISVSHSGERDYGKKQFKEIAKSNINFPPDSPIYKFITETIPDMEMQQKQMEKEVWKEMAAGCCEIC